MAEILIVFPKDKQQAAHRLYDAIAADGHDVALQEVTASNGASFALAERSSECAEAVIFIWSKALLLSGSYHDLIEKTRRERNVIEASADGVMPIKRADDPVALLSGWRGEPFHPGWQRIDTELKRICGAGRKPEVPPIPSARGTDRRGANRQADPPANLSRGSEGKLTLMAVAMLLLAAGAGFITTWVGRTDDQAVVRKDAAAAASSATSTTRQAAQVVMESSALASVPPASGPLPEAVTEPVPAVSRSEAAPPRDPPPSSRIRDNKANMKLFCQRSGRSTRECRAFRRSLGPEEPGPNALARQSPGKKRINYRNSRNMRLFCERAGRDTPQCRVFRRNTGGR